MPDGGTVTIVVEQPQLGRRECAGLPAGDYVGCRVSDTGTGIAPEHLEKVMEPFFTTKEVGKGSGLGLSMVYGFAKQSNGAFRIWKASSGKGTTAELWLPRAPEAAERSTVGIPAEGSRRRSADRARCASCWSTIMPRCAPRRPRCSRSWATRSSRRPTAQEALTALKNGECDCDLLISDYAMPHLSGTEFLRQARKICPDVPALIITGYAEADAVRDRPEGVEILLKPFTPSALEKAVARICGGGPVTH